MERNSNRGSVALPKTPLKCSLPNARRARTTRPADTQQSRPNPQFSFDSKTCGLRKVLCRENTETFETSRGRAAPPRNTRRCSKKETCPKDHCPHPSHPGRPDRWRNGLQSRSLYKFPSQGDPGAAVQRSFSFSCDSTCQTKPI